MRFVYQNRTGQPWDEPGHDGGAFHDKRSLRYVFSLAIATPSRAN
jgi:hypothetical protein